MVKSLEAALWAFHGAEDFSEAVLTAVNLGDDADTTGAVCGQLAGACWGETGIPVAWRDGPARTDIKSANLHPQEDVRLPAVEYFSDGRKGKRHEPRAK